MTFRSRGGPEGTTGRYGREEEKGERGRERGGERERERGRG